MRGWGDRRGKRRSSAGQGVQSLSSLRAVTPPSPAEKSQNLSQSCHPEVQEWEPFSPAPTPTGDSHLQNCRHHLLGHAHPQTEAASW